MKSPRNPERSNLYIDPLLRSDMALKQVMLFELDIMAANEACLLHDYDVDCLHEYRVALRRTRIILSGIHDVFPACDVERFSMALSWLGEITGACRDLDVLLQHWPDYIKVADMDTRLVGRIIHQQAGRARNRLVKILHGRKYAEFKKRWRDYLTAGPAAEPEQNAEMAISCLAKLQIDKSFRKVVKKLESIKPDSSEKKLHKLRIACKNLRYMLDYFQGFVMNPAMVSLVPALKKLQDKLGVYQDLIVFRASLLEIRQNMITSCKLNEAVDNSIHQVESLLLKRLEKQRKLVLKAIKNILQSESMTGVLAGS